MKMIQLNYDEKIKVKNQTIEIDYDFVNRGSMDQSLRNAVSGHNFEQRQTFMSGYDVQDTKV